MKTNKLNVFIQFSEQEELLGQLVLDGREILFKYSESYLESGGNISPIKLSFDQTIQTTSSILFKGLFGVFSDSLPDAWGTLLMKKHLKNNGIAIETLNALEHLAFVGNNGLGALLYKPSTNNRSADTKKIDLDILDNNVQEVIKGESNEVVDKLFERGGSPGGARPKIYANYNQVTDSLIYGGANLQEGYTHWIIKFAANIDVEDIANVEMAYYYMALDAGLIMSESKLFTGLSGKKYFGTKRFDRIGNKRLHMISAAGLLHDDYEHSQLDYGVLMQEGSNLVDSAVVYEQILRQAAFNIFAHNRDDHSKNFAFLMDEFGKWEFAPSYDLTFSASSQGQHSTACAGNAINPGTKELLELTNHFSIKNGPVIIEQVKDSVSKWHIFAQQTRVSNISEKSIAKVLNELIKG
ncbi:MAG: phosphatidylinositol kinase [Flavobacteriales bacterium]|nr:MAG: phosphatidylinositol kinase [Flavobacteriales bacterium]